MVVVNGKVLSGIFLLRWQHGVSLNLPTFSSSCLEFLPWPILHCYRSKAASLLKSGIHSIRKGIPHHLLARAECWIHHYHCVKGSVWFKLWQYFFSTLWCPCVWGIGVKNWNIILVDFFLWVGSISSYLSWLSWSDVYFITFCFLLGSICLEYLLPPFLPWSDVYLW